MRPLRNNILVERDTEEVLNVKISESGLFLGGEGFEEISKEINENKNFGLNAPEFDSFSAEIKNKTTDKGTTTIVLNTGVVKYVGSKVDSDDIQVGDRVEFNSYGFSKFNFEGTEYLLMKDEAVIVNLSRN